MESSEVHKCQQCSYKCQFLIFDKSIVCGIVCVCEYDDFLLCHPTAFYFAKHFVSVTK